MHGLIFVTYENFLRQQFGSELLTQVREYTRSINGPSSFLTNQVYPDALLFDLVGYTCTQVGIQPDSALRAYGRYYITNELTGHLCAYLLQRVHSAQELLLTMSKAHRQMHAASEQVSPPFFKYELDSQNDGLVLTYVNHRRLCVLLQGAIEGAAERYDEQVTIRELSCMKWGNTECRFHLVFRPPTSSPLHNEQQRSSQYYQALANFVFDALPKDKEHGVTLHQLPMLMNFRHGDKVDPHTRPLALYQAIRLLEHAGLVSATPDTVVETRRYWRAPDATMH